MIRYGIIGSGMMGHEHIRNIALLDGGHVTAVMDPDAGMRHSALDLAGSHCTGFETLDLMLEKAEVDALIVAAPNHLHYEILKQVLATEHPVLIEKPLCTTLDHCLEIHTLSKQRRAPTAVAMEYRYMPPVQRLREELAAGTAGRLHMLSIREHRFPFLDKVGQWNRFNRNTGGTLVEKCCHYFDLMRLIVGAEPIRIFASAGTDVNHLDETYHGETPDIVDNAFVTVEFDNGVRSMLDLCMFAEGSYWQEVISATGGKARIEAMIPGPARFAHDGKERHSQVVVADRESRLESVHRIDVDHAILSAGDHHGSTFFQHQKFKDLILNGGTPEVSVHDGLLAVAMGLAAQQSAATGASVAFDGSAY